MIDAKTVLFLALLIYQNKYQLRKVTTLKKLEKLFADLALDQLLFDAGEFLKFHLDKCFFKI